VENAKQNIFVLYHLDLNKTYPEEFLVTLYLKGCA